MAPVKLFYIHYGHSAASVMGELGYPGRTLHIQWAPEDHPKKFRHFNKGTCFLTLDNDDKTSSATMSWKYAHGTVQIAGSGVNIRGGL
jgi:hypothetical protein